MIIKLQLKHYHGYPKLLNLPALGAVLLSFGIWIRFRGCPSTLDIISAICHFDFLQHWCSYILPFALGKNLWACTVRLRSMAECLMPVHQHLHHQPLVMDSINLTHHVFSFPMAPGKTVFEVASLRRLGATHFPGLDVEEGSSQAHPCHVVLFLREVFNLVCTVRFVTKRR